MSERYRRSSRFGRPFPRVTVPADDKPAVLLFGADWPAALSEDIAARALLEGRARGLWTHVTDRSRALASAMALRELADVCSAVDFARTEDWVAWARAEVADGTRFDVVFDIGSRTQQAAAEVAAEVGAPGNDPEAVRRLGDKDRCRAVLAAAGFAQPLFRLCVNHAEATEFLRGTRGPWIVKPRRSTGGDVVSLVTRPADLSAALARLPRRDRFLVEQFIDGREYSAEGVFLDGEPRILAVAEKQLEDGHGFRAAGRVLPADLPAHDLTEIERTVAAALRELGLSFGPFHVGLWLTDDGVVLGTVHARLGGGWIHVLLAHAIPDLELCGLVYGDALGHPVTAQSLVAERTAAVRFLTAPPGRFVRADHWRELLDHPAVLRAELTVEPGSPVGADDGGRVGMIIVAARTPAEATAVAADLAGSVRIIVEPDPPPVPGGPASRPKFIRGQATPCPRAELPEERHMHAAGNKAAVVDAVVDTTTTAEHGTAWQLALVAADSGAALAAGSAAVTARLEEGGAAAYGAVQLHATGTPFGAHRGALLAGGPAVEPVRVAGARAGIPAGERPLALMFPGLGDHYLDMGRDLYRDFPVFRGQVDRCARLLLPEMGLDLRELIFPARAAAEAAPTPAIDLRAMLGRGERTRGPLEQQLDRTSVAQPVLFVIEYALAKLWQTWGARPGIMIGYSLGEYVAACLAGVLSLDDSLTLVARRARLIESLPEGGMLAVLLSESEVVPLLGKGLSLSAVNGPEFCVVAGPNERIADLEATLAARSVVTRRVRSKHAFHSAMMAPIAAEVTALASTFERHAPRVPYVSNVTGELITTAEATDPAYWARHLCAPVRFAEGLAAIDSGCTLLEAGPGQTLSSIAAPGRAAGTVVASMRHSRERHSDTAVVLRALARVWLTGTAFDWHRLPVDDLRIPADFGPDRGSGAASTATTDVAVAEGEPTATEVRLTAVWERLLKFPVASPSTSFFDIGGNSLLATRLMLRVSREFGVELTLRQVYEYSTVVTMAAAIDDIRAGGAGIAAAATRNGTATGTPIDTATRAGGAASIGTGTAVADRPRFELPNGLLIHQQNEAETLHFYEDIFAHRTYARHGISIPDGATVLDVGGNIGLFTLFAHHEARNVRVLSFEPAPPLFELLSSNVADHGVNAKLFNHGISDREATASFTFYPRSSGMSSFHPDKAEEKHNLRTIIANQHAAGGPGRSDAALDEHAEELLDVRFEAVTFTAALRPLSTVIAEQGIDVIDLIKIDVQKSELEVIAGIADGNWPKIRQMVLEVHDSAGNVAYLVNLLRNRGFTVRAEQDELYVGTDIHNVYAIRSE